MLALMRSIRGLASATATVILRAWHNWEARTITTTEIQKPAQGQVDLAALRFLGSRLIGKFPHSKNQWTDSSEF